MADDESLIAYPAEYMRPACMAFWTILSGTHSYSMRRVFDYGDYEDLAGSVLFWFHGSRMLSCFL